MKRLLLFLLITSGLLAQGTGGNVVSTQIASSDTIVATTAFLCGTNTCPNPPNIGTTIQNIGQSFHNITVFVNAFTTSATQVTAVMQGSTDGGTWFNIGPNTVTSIASGTAATIQANGFGAYPYLRVNVSAYPLSSSGMTVTIIYTGVSTSAITLSDENIYNSNIAFKDSGSLTLAVTNNVMIAAPPAASSGARARPVIYGLIIDYPTTATSLVISCSSVTTTHLLDIVNFPASQGYPLSLGGVSNKPWAFCSPGDGVLLNMGGTGVASYTVQYRYE